MIDLIAVAKDELVRDRILLAAAKLMVPEIFAALTGFDPTFQNLVLEGRVKIGGTLLCAVDGGHITLTINLELPERTEEPDEKPGPHPAR